MKSKIGWVLSILVSALLLWSAYGKLTAGPEMIEMMEKTGFGRHLLMPIAVTETISTVLFLIPQTAFFGAILLTGYMGGAICHHLRLGEPMIVPIIVPIIVWIGYGLRNFDGIMRLIKNRG